jgi:hypothetical protein
MQAEPLGSDGVAILQSGITDRPPRHAGLARQHVGDALGVPVALANPQPQMFALALGDELRQFIDEKVFRAGAQNPAQRWLRGVDGGMVHPGSRS